MAPEVVFQGKLGLQQRVFPEYRKPFFARLAERCGGGLQMIAGDPRASESITPASDAQAFPFRRTKNIHMLGGSLYFCWQRDIMSWLAEWDPEVVVFEANPRCLSNDQAVKWMRDRGRPVIGWGLGAPPLDGLEARLRLRRRQRYLMGFDALIAYSHRGAQEYEQVGFPPDRIFIAYNAVAPAPKSVPVHPPAVNRKLEVLFVGRLQERKRVDLLIEASKPFEAEIALTVVGEGPARAGLEALAGELAPAVRFMGEIHGEDLEPYYRSADLFVLPFPDTVYNRGRWPNKICDYMSLGRPTVSNPCGDIKHLFDRHEIGLLAEWNEEDFASKIVRLLEDPNLAHRLGEEARRISVYEYSWQVLVERLEGFYWHLMEENKRIPEMVGERYGTT